MSMIDATCAESHFLPLISIGSTTLPTTSRQGSKQGSGN
jgi:hypothetical protein